MKAIWNGELIAKSNQIIREACTNRAGGTGNNGPHCIHVNR